MSKKAGFDKIKNRFPKNTTHKIVEELKKKDRNYVYKAEVEGEKLPEEIIKVEEGKIRSFY